MAYDYGRFVWFELVAGDKARAVDFYTEVVGWKVQTTDLQGMKYDMLFAGDTPVGGLATPPKAGVPSHWVSYLSVKDVDNAAKAVKRHGGELLADAFDVPTVGRMQPVADPHGAPFFVFHDAKEDGPAATGPGSFHWNELLTADPEAAVSFYEKAFGYTHETMDMPDGTYFVVKNGDAPRAGVVKPPLEALTHWLQYVAVDDCDAAVERTERRGGQVAIPATDVPGVGRFAVIVDPVGARLGVMKPAET